MATTQRRFSTTANVRYFEADQQGVVFHMWYLAYLEDARNAFLEYRGLPLRRLLALGSDLQVVHTELDWTGSAHWGECPTVSVEPSRIGTTSFTLSFEVNVADTPVLRASTVYVTIDQRGSKQALPDELRRCLVGVLSTGEVR